MLTGVAHDARRERRRGDDHRHVQRRFVKQKAVRQLAVLAERFAVIAGDDDDRVAAIDRREQARHLRVDVRDLAVVRLRIRRRRRVRRVRIVEMHPGEERARVVLPQPRQRAVDDLARRGARLRRFRCCRSRCARSRRRSARIRDRVRSDDRG